VKRGALVLGWAALAVSIGAIVATRAGVTLGGAWPTVWIAAVLIAYAVAAYLLVASSRDRLHSARIAFWLVFVPVIAVLTPSGPWSIVVPLVVMHMPIAASLFLRRWASQRERRA
jgi:hypothetical protein